ncbi:HAD family hydrolase [Phenylobacterium sp.]|uniref:HAD family hydrolase n=1 Tax=Phenylobacterium sp. TaxID=1871053 RepID=UPI002732C30B|nr:HAD-IA family hydrolase [Phenylobacterium sp.]MDP3855832.1 HAD-IA family hydrolase [Phenylobacterium sp.]
MALRCLMVDVDGVVARRLDGTLWNRDSQADLGLDPKAFQDAFFAVHWPDVVIGRADLHERLGPVLQTIAPHLRSDQVTAYWFEQDGHLDQALLDDLAAYRAAGLELHLATVQEHHRARHLWEVLGLNAQFEAMHYAADYGCKKPDAAFFRMAEQRSGFAPHELLLIDDSPRNVEGARACGWAAILWTGEVRLPEAMAQAGF